MHVPSVASLRAVAEVHLLTTLSTFQSHMLGEHMRLSEVKRTRSQDHVREDPYRYLSGYAINTTHYPDIINKEERRKEMREIRRKMTSGWGRLAKDYFFSVSVRFI